MKQKLNLWIHSARELLGRHRKLIIITSGCAFVLLVTVILVCNILVDADRKYILPASSTKHVRVGIVLGAGITSKGKPFRELQARLDIAAKELDRGQVDKLILSGDNRFKNYNEPKAMINYLEQVKHINASKLQPDYAGRSTYESCEREIKIFGVNETIIYSAGSHLPRAIYLCRHFGITAYGVSSGVEANNSTRRELLARVKAVFNIYINGEHTVLGPPIKV